MVVLDSSYKRLHPSLIEIGCYSVDFYLSYCFTSFLSFGFTFCWSAHFRWP